jgi:hypothetical protein
MTDEKKDIRLECLRLAIAAGRGDPVGEAERYVQFLSGEVTRPPGKPFDPTRKPEPHDISWMEAGQ